MIENISRSDGGEGRKKHPGICWKCSYLEGVQKPGTGKGSILDPRRARTVSKGWENLELEAPPIPTPPPCSSHQAAIMATLLVTLFVPGFNLL